MENIHDLLAQLINRGREQRNLEYKRSMNWAEMGTRDKITRAVLGFSNVRDGGYIIIGVEEQDDQFIPVGVEPIDKQSFKHDDVSVHVNNFADPYSRIDVHHVAHEGRDFVVIQVHEFEEVPVICKRDSAKLRCGAIYTRSWRKPETIEVPGQTEMREIIEMGVEKGMRRLWKMLTRAGLKISGPSLDDEERFDEQLDGL